MYSDHYTLLFIGTPASTETSHPEYRGRPETLSGNSKIMSRSSSRQKAMASRGSAMHDDSDVMSNVTTHSKANVGFLKSQLNAYTQKQ